MSLTLVTVMVAGYVLVTKGRGTGFPSGAARSRHWPISLGGKQHQSAAAMSDPEAISGGRHQRQSQQAGLILSEQCHPGGNHQYAYAEASAQHAQQTADIDPHQHTVSRCRSVAHIDNYLGHPSQNELEGHDVREIGRCQQGGLACGGVGSLRCSVGANPPVSARSFLSGCPLYPSFSSVQKPHPSAPSWEFRAASGLARIQAARCRCTGPTSGDR